MISKIRRFVPALALLALGVAAAPLTHAETIIPQDLPLLQHTELAGGEFGIALGFIVPVAGSVSVELKDLVWPAAFESLSVMIVKGVSVLGSLTEPGQFDFDASAPGKYYALVIGDAQTLDPNDLDLGLYSLNVIFNAGGASVPLPAAGWLLLSGFAAITALARRRKVVATA